MDNIKREQVRLAAAQTHEAERAAIRALRATLNGAVITFTYQRPDGSTVNLAKAPALEPGGMFTLEVKKGADTWTSAPWVPHNPDAYRLVFRE